MATQSAHLIVDLIASGASPKEVCEAVNSGLYDASLDCVEDYKSILGNRFFDEAADIVTKGAKPPMPMKSVKGRMPKGYKESPEAKRQNNELLATGENAAGADEALAQYRGEPRGSMGVMNPLGSDRGMRPFSGDRRPNRPNGPRFPNDDGTVPNGAGV
ncbi:MAG: hypothetical protein CMP84_13360 [Gammaproteobacteria bacterium]|nr:hypothetical protein [Gammaproteobacteria bacterium]|tara:strand:- start:4382 stop:4858 length:477 start_codon:yes stop_codon:yes gene_type:complete